MAGVPAWLPATELGVVAAVVGSLLVVRWLDRTRDWGQVRRSRLLLGVPWGTLVSILGVLAVYLLVQGGLGHWYDPVTVAFRSWSYFYPLGMAVAPFAHNGVSHLTGNLLGTLVLGTLAEYAWGHFPEERGASAFASPRTNPYVRAFVAFPAGVVLVGLATALFGWGPVIGFSGVVFAFAGFSLVRYPLGTVIALEVRDVVGLVYRALREPVVVGEAKPRFITPWWAGIAVQGHLLGLFLGVLAGAVVLRRRERSPTRLWAGTLVVAAGVSLWAIWWFRGNARYVLFRGLGVVLVFALALLVTLALRARASDEPLLGVPRRTVGLLVVLLPILVVAFVAVPLNLSTVADPTPPGDGPTIEVRDYTVVYAENTTNRMTSVVNVSVLGEETTVRASGVIVISEERHLWTTAVSTARLAFAGRTSVPLGGVGWREEVGVRRRGWTAVGNGTAYKVWLRPPDGGWKLAFRSSPVVAEPVIRNRTVAIRPANGTFVLAVRRNGSRVGAAPIPPPPNGTVVAGGITFVREGKQLYATVDGTRVRIAAKETYRGE